MRQVTSSDQRRRWIASIHASAAQLGMDTADKSPSSDYRAMLLQHGGKRSTTDMDDDALRRVMRHLLQALRPGRPPPPPDGWHAEKMRRLWRDLAQLGALHEPTDQGLNRFVEHTTGKTAPRFCSSIEGNRVVEALKAWIARETAKQAR